MPAFALKQFQQKPKRKILFRISIFDHQLNKGKAIICHTIYFRNFVVGDHSIFVR